LGYTTAVSVILAVDRPLTNPHRAPSPGEIAVIAMRPQTRMSEDDAAHTAKMLNGRASSGDRNV